MSLGNADETRDGRDVDDGGGPAVGTVSSGLEKGNEGHGHEVRTVDVGLVGIHPVLVGDIRVHVLLEFGGVVAFGLGLAGGNTTDRREDCMSTSLRGRMWPGGLTYASLMRMSR